MTSLPTDRHWVPISEDGVQCWVPGTLRTRSATQLVFSCAGGQEIKLPAPSGAESRLRDLELVAQDQLDGVEDICSLSSVSEGAVLETLRTRFSRGEIYTAVSQGILLAVNPSRDLPDTYSPEVQAKYASAADSSILPPHVYRVAQAALLNLRMPDSPDQAILIGGESGAGKTESTKHIISFLVGPARGDENHVFEKALSANVVLEAFGNATTTRNGNSSRFGKWLNIKALHVGNRLQVEGCQLTHYLLETARVCSHARGERNFHMLYQLLAGPKELLSELGLQADPGCYAYLCASSLEPECRGAARIEALHSQTGPGLRSHVGADDFNRVREALAACCVEPAVQKEIFRILAGILELGNCRFDKSSDESQLLAESPAKHAAELLGISAECLMTCMLFVTRQIPGGEETRSPTSPAQAECSRDGLAQLLYGQLFEWLIRHINCELRRAVQMTPSQQRTRSLGILDIAGFECFERNSLEQFLINLSNEYLQQSFNSHVFKTEQRDCLIEGIEVDIVGFTDNQDCLDLMVGVENISGGSHSKKPGILDYLDEGVTMPRATDSMFVAKVNASFSAQGASAGHARFNKSRFGDNSFEVKHFAGVVKYSCDGWLHKNAGKPPLKAIELFAGSELKLVRELCSQDTRRGKRTQSASHSFRTSLRSLMERVEASNVSFVRCIKPKGSLQEDATRFFMPKVVHQLRCGGIFEAIRIRQSGYSFRWPFDEFVARYGVLARVAGRAQPTTPQELVSLLRTVAGCSSSAAPGDQALVAGHTKVFAKTSVASALELRRLHVLQDFAMLMQRSGRTLLARRHLARAARLAASASEGAAASQERGFVHNSLPVEAPARGARPSLQKSGSQSVIASCASSESKAPDARSGGRSLPSERRPSRSSEPAGDVVPAAPEVAASTQRFAQRRLMFERASSGSRSLPALRGDQRAATVAAAPTSRSPPQWKVRILDALTDAISKRDVSALVSAIKRGENAHLSENQLQQARSTLLEERKRAAPVALNEALASSDATKLRSALAEAELAGLDDGILQHARCALMRLTAESTLQDALDELARIATNPADMLRRRKAAALESAIQEAGRAGAAEECLQRARKALAAVQLGFQLREATRSRDLAVIVSCLRQVDTWTLEEVRIHFPGHMLGSAHRTILDITRQEVSRDGDAARLQAVIMQTDHYNNSNPEPSLADAIRLANQELARMWMSSDDPDVLQRAINHGRFSGNAREELAGAIRKRTAILAQTRLPFSSDTQAECAICFLDEEPTSTMSCCGREGSTNFLCTTCLVRMDTCPFCRAVL